MVDDVLPAFRTYEAIDPAAADGDGLNLAWTRDERACLAVDLAAILADELRAEADEGLPYLDRYLVRDPYGEATLGPAVLRAFGRAGGRITCGAGVVSLLHGVARIAPRVRIVGDVYPDVPYWCGGVVEAEEAGAWFVDRPSFVGDALAGLGEVEALCSEAAGRGAIVIADESNANYYPPEWSAATLPIENLVVIRGFSKGYGLGGLRLAYAVASPSVTERIRACVPPLLASSVSLRIGARVLGLGDVMAPLRERIVAHKRESLALLAGVEGVVAASAYLPYVVGRSEALQAHVEARGIRGKLHPLWSGGRLCHLYRLSVPLVEPRMERLRALLAC